MASSALLLLMIFSATGIAGTGSAAAQTGGSVALRSPAAAAPLTEAIASLQRGAGPADGSHLECAGSVSGTLQCSRDAVAATSRASSAPQWTNLTGPVAPPRSNFFAMTYDVADQYVVLFGGQSASAYALNDTWTFANGTWTNITATAGTAPSARYSMAMTYDAADGYVLAFGGSSITTSCPCNDTWSFLHGKWSRILTNPPYGYDGGGIQVERFSMTYDAADGYVLATDGTDTWRYSAGTWSSFCGTNCTNFIPAPGGVGTVAYDVSDGYVVFVGSDFNLDSVPSELQDSYTWRFLGGTWTNITATAGTPPPAREFASLVSDSATGGLLFFGGLSSDASGDIVYLNDTWSFVGGTWSPLSADSSPPGLYGAGVADESPQSLIVLFGGNTAQGAAGNLNETWVWGSSPPIGELSLTVNPSTPVPGTNATFVVSFAGGVAPFTYHWSFGDGGSSAAPGPNHDYASDGDYLVQVWVNDSAGHSVHASRSVDVYTPLSVSAIQATPNPALLGEAVNFTASAAGGTPPYTFSWAFGDGGLGGNLSSITHIYTTDGPFDAEVTVTDAAGGTARGFVNVTIQLQALAGSTVTSGPYPLTVSFIGQAQGGVPPYRYSWSFGDGATSTLQNPRYTYDSSGHYTVVLTVTDSRDNVSTSALSIQVGGSLSSGIPASTWFYAFIAALVGGACVAAVASATILRRRGRRREGERWVEELTSGPEGRPDAPPPGPR